jgi:hypothetical protein
MSENIANARPLQNAQNTDSNANPIIRDEHMNYTVLRAFNIIRERNEPRVIKFIEVFSKFRNARGQSMFNFVNSEGNNIFMEACLCGLTNASLMIIQDYNNWFKLGLSNFRGMTALMICIDKNMFLTAFELLNFPDALPEIRNDNIRFNTIDLILTKNLRDNTTINILADIIRSYLEYNPNSQQFHRNLNDICTDQNLVQRLQGIIGVNEIDFSKICAPIQQAKAEAVVNPRRSTQPRSNLAEVHNISYNTRNVTQNIGRAQHAEPTENDQIAVPANDMNFDANDYTPQQFERLRLRKRGPPSGGKKKRTNLTNRKKRTIRKKPKHTKKTKHTKHKIL